MRTHRRIRSRTVRSPETAGDADRSEVEAALAELAADVANLSRHGLLKGPVLDNARIVALDLVLELHHRR